MLALVVLVGDVDAQEQREVHAREHDVVTGAVEPHLDGTHEGRKNLGHHHEYSGEQEDDRDLSRAVRVDEHSEPGECNTAEALHHLRIYMGVERSATSIYVGM